MSTASRHVLLRATPSIGTMTISSQVRRQGAEIPVIVQSNTGCLDFWRDS